MNLTCWKCGATVAGVILPLSRREECPACCAELCVCKQCQHYDSAISRQCREERAEHVSNKERANFCDYFQLRPDAYIGPGKSDQTGAQLAALFGGDDQQDEGQASLDDLFGSPTDSSD